ncbi:hypothetical protein [Serratia fonticola]|jgi:hypothetical protein
MRKLKILLSVITALASITVLVFVVFKHPKKDSYVFKCEADVQYDVDDGDEKSSIDALYVLTLDRNKKGFLHMSGVVKRAGQKYDLRRTYYFDYSKNEKVDVYNVLITEEKTSIYDAVDSQFFHKTFMPEKPGSSIHIKAGKIKDNLYIFDGFTYTHLLCSEG